MEIDQTLGLHEIPKKAMALTRINGAIKQIVDNLQGFIDNTRNKVQLRQSYMIKRINTGEITPGTDFEIKIERALWAKYHQAAASVGDRFLESCPLIAGYSVGLFAERKQNNWGEIDLLGISPDGKPIPIELKQDMGDNILKMIIQVAAYAIAVQRVWNEKDSKFQASWRDLGLENCFNGGLDKVECICLATEAYWQRAFGDRSNRRIAGQIQADSWGPIKKLINEFQKKGIEISFATVVLGTELPTISSCNSVELPK